MIPKELSQLNLDKIKAITFDVDGVIVPTGTDIKGNKEGTELIMKTYKPSQKFFDNIKKLKKHLWINFSSGRNILYLQELLSPILWDKVSLQAENGNITFIEGVFSSEYYSIGYFDLLKRIKEEVKEEDIRGFEPKSFLLTIHCDENENIPKIVERLDTENILYCQWTKEGYDIGHKDISKGQSLFCICNHLKCEPKEILTTGNNLNDAEMLDIGTGITVEPDRVDGEYKTSGKGLGGEEVAQYLVDYYEKN